MKTTDLFNFQFVDRKKEQETLNNFFQNKTETALWIKGNSGFGKTTFFNYVYTNWSNYSLCYISIKEESNAADMILDFVLELQKICGINFLSIIKDRYKGFYNNIYKNTKAIAGGYFPVINNIISIIMDSAYEAVTIHDKHVNSCEMINDYIHTILENRKLCICIDNFSRCDLETANLLFQIFKTFLNEEYFRGCIITTNEDISDNLYREILYQLPFTEIKIDKLDKYIYFCEILKPIFDLKDFDQADIEYLYNKCEGSPQKLSTIISKLLERNGITIYKSSKARIQKNILFSILQAEHIYFKESDFNAIQKWIIFSYLCLYEKTEVKLLEEMALYLARQCKFFSAYNQASFQTSLFELIENKILKYNQDDTISTWHDLDYRELMDIFQESPFKPMISHFAYTFIEGKDDIGHKQPLLCRHARDADISNWEQINFLYGKFLMKNNLPYDAHKIFLCLKHAFPKLHIMQRLFVVITSYETGNFQLAINQLESICVDELYFPKAKFFYFFYMGKSYNNIGHTPKAAELLEKALKEVAPDSREYVQTLNVLHMYYLEIPGMFEKAVTSFNKIRNNYKDQYPDIWANTIRGCHNFVKNDEALSLLKEAETILENKVERAYLKTTEGYIHIRRNEHKKAQVLFEKASEVIKTLKVHESSYALNNLAICYMLNSKYEKAHEILLEALLWNRTEYGNIVIQSHLMICALHLNLVKEAEDYYEFLNAYMEKYPDIGSVVKRKIFLNLAIASAKLNKLIVQKVFLEKAKSVIAHTSSEWRYYALSKQIDNCPIERPSDMSQITTDFEPWFLIYAHD